MKDADLLWTTNVEAGAEHQHRDEEGHSAARLSAERWRQMEQELPTAESVQRNLHLDQHTANALPEPQADTREPEPAEVSEALFQGHSSSASRCLSRFIATLIGC